MTSNIRRLGALAVAQAGSFVIVLFLGVFGGPGHQAGPKPTPTPSPTHTVVSPTARATPAKSTTVGPSGNTHLGGQGATTPPVTTSPSAPRASTPAATATRTTATPAPTKTKSRGIKI